ncbi:MAG: CPBP family intramembrane glutamic endopeptidase [Segetibacter sp.]
MLWGYHGNLDLLKFIIKDWSPPGEHTQTRQSILHWVLWDRELISFGAGTFLLVFIPTLIIRYGFKHSLRDYGLALPSKEKRSVGLMLFITLILFSLYPFYIAAKNTDMQLIYPFYKHFSSITQFILYELSYFPFFLAIEFIFRGYLLLGLSYNSNIVYSPKSANYTIYNFGKYAITISMLSYTAWHLGKPLTELWGTPIWGLVAGAGTYYVRSIWPVLMAHFLLNVFLDGMILYNLHIFPSKY